jgi:phospholipase C
MSLQNNNLDKIEHIVVLMMENRSFDNVLGWLYPDNPDFRGVNGSMSNPAPDGSLVYVSRGTDPTAPYPDPNEPYDYVYRQMYGDLPTPPIPNTTDTPPMQGFVIDYADAICKADAEAKKKGNPPFATEPGVIMNCYAPESLPVINGLAQSYAVCDNWFSSVPTQTFPNRSFIHAATSSGNVYNTWKTGTHFWDKGIFINNTKTIYNLLEENKVGWKVYHGGPLLLCNTLIIQEQLWEFAFTGDRFFPYEQFLSDVKTPGALPAYTFIEPNMMCSSKYGPENDMHPAYAILEHGSPTDVRYGDKLIHDIYTALRESDYWEKTLFVITFDEHGGCFDHQPTPPPPTVSPDDVVIPYTDGRNGGSGFDFTRFGVRVPSVLVSPWIEEGTICHTQFDHTSVIKTVSNKWLGGQNLTKRDAAANCISEVLSLSLPRTNAPDFTPVTPPPFEGCAEQPLSPLQSDMMAAAAQLVAHKTKRLIDLSVLDTKEKVAEALEDISGEFLAR